MLRRRWRAFAWRGAALAVVFVCGLVAFLCGVGVSERPGLPDAGILTKVYYTVGLFVLGGLDLGTPVGGPAAARYLLWFSYFAAPLITASAVIEGVLRAVDPDRWRARRLRDHVIIAGCGRLALLYLRRLREERPAKPVVIVELRQDHPDALAVREVYRAQLVIGDIGREGLSEALALRRADRVMLFTGDDFANLDAATRLLQAMPDIGARTVVHVSNIGFMRDVASTRVAQECTIINTHQLAARHLVDTELRPRFDSTHGDDIVVLFGFGRFGQTVLDELQKCSIDKLAGVVIVDLEASHAASMFAQQVGFAKGYWHEVVDGDLRDPHVWRDIASKHDFAQCAPVFILGCGDDGVNLRAALWASETYPESYVVARSFYNSTFASEVARDANFHTFSVADLVTENIPDEWFGS